MDVVLFPDPVLRKAAATITVFDGALRTIASEMHALMAKAKGVGLAAPQVGLSIRLLVLNETGKPADAMTLVNPKITAQPGLLLGEEGCLSFPGIYAEIARAEFISIEAQDLTGAPIRLELNDWVARIVQHEFDHLEGVLFIDRMSAVDKVRVRGALKALEADFKPRTTGSR